jgi:hypothetical protein
MSSQLNRSTIRLLAVLCFLWVIPASASAQLPAKDDAPLTGESLLRAAKSIYIRSSSLLVGNSVIEEKLQKRAEFSQLGLMITREPEAADLILEVHHDRLTKYVYTAIDRRTNMVLASGKLSSLGGTVAGKVAKRFLKQVLQARATAPNKVSSCKVVDRSLS